MVGIWRLGLLLCLGLAAEPLLANPITLAPNQMRQLAAVALEYGQHERAQAYADALLKRDPDDITARLIASRAARNIGQNDKALDHARAAWSLATSEQERYGAALLTAQALASDNKHTRAQLWLRRAHHIAPSDAHAAKAQRDFRYVRSRNPWQTYLSFSVQPNSNINNGSSERFSTLNYQLTKALFGEALEYELGGSSVALEGIEYRFGLNTRYRFRETQNQAQDLFFELDLRQYTLSDEAKEIAPDAVGSDFSFTSVSAGYGIRGLNRQGRGEARGRFEFGQSWYAGDELARFAQVTGGQAFFHQDGARTDLSLTTKRQFGQTIPDVDSLTGDIVYRQRVGNGHYLLLNLSLGTADSPNSDYSYDTVGASMQLALAEPVMNANLVFGLSLSRRDYDTSRHSEFGRRDDKLSLDMTMIFREVDYYGFNPTVTFTAARTDSTVGLYTADRVGLSFGIRSAF